jgi:hypothetical protein
METIIDYDEYIDKLLKYMERNNGKHNINREKANQWINAQPTKDARYIAKKIIDITIYVTFNDVKKYVKQLILEHYKVIQDNPDNEIHMFIGKKEKSNYFLSMLGLYYIKKYKFREPTFYFTEIPKTVIKLKNSRKNPVLIYIDDMAYSGGQIMVNMNTIMISIYKKYCVDNFKNFLKGDDIENINENSESLIYELLNILKTKLNTKKFDKEIDKEIDKNTDIEFDNISKMKKNIYEQLKNYEYYKIYFLLLGINDIAINRIEEASKFIGIYETFKKIIIMDTINDLPFNISYNFNWVLKYNSLEYYLTEKDIFLVCYYFSVGRIPPVALYYDHNIADNMSTLLMIYNYGIVVPKNYDIANYWKYFKEILNPKMHRYIQSNYYILPYAKRFYELCNKYYLDVKSNQYQDIGKPIKFIPFINNCKNITTIITNPLMKHINYILLVLINSQTIVRYNNDPLINSPIFSYDNLLDKICKKNDLKQNIINFLNVITHQKCNLAFYKVWETQSSNTNYTNSKIFTKKKIIQKVETKQIQSKKELKRTKKN